MTTQARPCPIFTLPSLDLDLSAVTWVRYRRDHLDRQGQRCEELTAAAYVHVLGGMVAIRGDEEVHAFRAAWLAYKATEKVG